MLNVLSWPSKEESLKDTRQAELIKTGKDYFDRGDFQRALVIFSELVEVSDKNSEPYFYLGNIFHMQGDLGKAIRAFQKVLELDPCHTDASISLSILYNDIGRYEEGQKIFNMTAERVKSRGNPLGQGVQDVHVNKKFAMKHYELAEMYMSYNRFDEALFEYNKTVSLDPENLESRVKVAKVYAKKGFVTKAFDELRKLRNENPSFIPAHIALGILHYGNGNVVEAQTQWRKVLSLEPTNQEATMYMNLSRGATETQI